MDLALRPPRAGDGDGLARCWLDAGASYAALNPALFQIPDAAGLAQSLEERFLHLAAAQDSLALVADADGHVVGYLFAAIEHPSPRAATDASRDAGLTRLLINALIVREASRHHGVGTRLMDAAERWGRARGAAIALLDTYDSPLSVPFYERHLGYSRRALRLRKALSTSATSATAAVPCACARPFLRAPPRLQPPRPAPAQGPPVVTAHAPGSKSPTLCPTSRMPADAPTATSSRATARGARKPHLPASSARLRSRQCCTRR